MATDPRDNLTPDTTKDQHKLSIGAYEGAIERIAESVFNEARTLGVRCKFSITHPGTILNDGTGKAYLDLSEKASNQGSFHYEWAMDPTEPLTFPPLPEFP